MLCTLFMSYVFSFHLHHMNLTWIHILKISQNHLIHIDYILCFPCLLWALCYYDNLLLPYTHLKEICDISFELRRGCDMLCDTSLRYLRALFGLWSHRDKLLQYPFKISWDILISLDKKSVWCSLSCGFLLLPVIILLSYDPYMVLC